MLKLKFQYFGHLIRTDLLEDPDAGKDWRGGREGDDRGWAGWMTSLTRWTWVWANSGSWWWTGRPGVLQSMGSQRVGHDRAIELNWGKYPACMWCSQKQDKTKENTWGRYSQSSAFLKLPGCVYQAAMVEKYWFRENSSFRALRMERFILLPGCWSIRGGPWTHLLAWALITWKDGPDSPITLVPVPTLFVCLMALWVIFLRINDNPVTHFPFFLQNKSREWRPFKDPHAFPSIIPSALCSNHTEERAHLILVLFPPPSLPSQAPCREMFA